MTDHTLSLTLARIFDAPVEQVWNAWTQAETLKRWWGPTGFTAPVARMDFREGGTSLIAMRSPEGHDMYNLWVYTHIEPMQRIEFTQYWSDPKGIQVKPGDIGFPADLPYAVPHVLEFKVLNDNQTKLIITESGYTSTQHVGMSRAGMGQCLDKLADSLK
jgi:uncharacterized protein YndB with AHSA1/START domain